MNPQERSDGFKKWIADSDIFDIDLWWAPTFRQGFVIYDDFEKQMADYKAFGITGGIVTAHAAAFHDGHKGNEELAQLLQGHEGFYGCMVLLPEMGFTPDKGEAYVRGLMDRGFVAARLFPKTYVHSMEEYTVGPILDTLEKLGIPLMLWHTEATWNDMDRICALHPGLKVIVEGHDRKLLYHARDYVGLMRKHSNFYVETHNLVLFNEIETISKYCGCDQLLYGSYFPYMTPHFSLYTIKEAVIAEEDRQKIISGNARRIFPL